MNNLNLGLDTLYSKKDRTRDEGMLFLYIMVCGHKALRPSTSILWYGRQKVAQMANVLTQPT